MFLLGSLHSKMRKHIIKKAGINKPLLTITIKNSAQVTL